MKTTPLPLILLLSLLLLAPTAKAEGEVTNTYWQVGLANVSVGTDGTPTDVQITITGSDTLYTVKTALGLAWIANITNNKDSVYQADGKGYLPLYPHQKGFKNCTVKLGDDDIPLSDHFWTPIGKNSSTYFNGTFDGNHKVVTGLKIEGGTDTENINIGLFGYLSGNVHDLGIQVAAEGIKVKGKNVSAGALAGYNYGIIQNCFAIGESTAAIDVEATGTVSLGGLIGWNNGGSITNCYATLNVKGASGNSRTTVAGGLVGAIYRRSNISHVYATGKVEATGQNNFQMGGVGGYIDTSTLSHALAANKEGITAKNTQTSDFLGRVCGCVYISNCDTATCYASTKIRMNGKVTGVGNNGEGKHFDGINADTDTDLSELFPTKVDGAVWEYSTSNGTPDNLPILKGFTSGLQGTTAKTDVFDSPLDLSTLTANNNQNSAPSTYVADSLIFSNTEGWIHRQGTAEQRTAFSGRVKGTGTNVQLAITTDTAAVLSFLDKTELTGPTYSAIRICESQTGGKKTDITLRSEGTVTVKSSGQSATSIQADDNTTCRIDPKGHFLIYGGYSNSKMISGVMQWTWDPNSAPESNITVNWEGGSVTIPCDDSNSHNILGTNPGGDNITVRVGNDYQEGKLGGSGNAVSTFKFADSETRAAITYSDMQNITDAKGTENNPYVIDLAALSTSATADGYTYSTDNNRKIVTLNYTGSNDSVYYSIENQAANNAHILLTSADGLEKPLHLKARSGSFVDSLQVPASADWTLKGDTLKASYVEVSGGLKLDGPVTVENTKTSNYPLKVLADGSVTANDVLKAYAAGKDAIDIEGQGTLTIGGEGKVYTYGWINAINRNKLSIDKGGILRCAGSINGNEFGFPVIQWDFTNKPETELVARQGSEEVWFTREMFGKYFDKASSFAANVTENATYKLYQVPESEELIGINLRGDIVETFSTTAGQRTIYINVGKPTPKINDEKNITVTASGTYKDSNEATHEFNNILEGSTVSLLKIEAPITMAIESVNADSLVVKSRAALYLNGENKLDSIAILEGGIFSIGETSSTTGLTCSKGVVNRGSFTDYTGLIRSVTIPLADKDVVFSLDIPADVEVARGGRTELKPSGKIPDGATASVAYQWFEWKDNEWTLLRGYNNQSYSFGAGKYQCYVVVTLSNASLKSTAPTVTTLLTSFFTVTEKSTPPAPPVV
ncbi:GLUG motif-containing protein, partial [uncultured Parabacteroides sp.]|uniref:GLUG motif-containing protein n=1 Tax=uncultured Parabacteroides sp. TaxID=512312 RepID=UPI0025CEA76A